MIFSRKTNGAMSSSRLFKALLIAMVFLGTLQQIGSCQPSAEQAATQPFTHQHEGVLTPGEGGETTAPPFRVGQSNIVFAPDMKASSANLVTSNSTFIYDEHNSFSPEQIKQLALVDVYVVKPSRVVVNTKGKVPFSVKHPVAYRRWMTFNTCFAPVLFGLAGAGLQGTTAARVR